MEVLWGTKLNNRKVFFEDKIIYDFKSKIME